MLKERRMDPVSISTHGVSFLSAPVSATDYIIPPVHKRFLTHTHAHTPLCDRWLQAVLQLLGL